MDFNNLQTQKLEVKRGLRTQLQVRGLWEPICSEWFAKWKAYVDFDNEEEDTRPDEQIKELFPGPINNEVLQGSFGDELSRKIQEGKDYVLLPSFVAKKLFTHYSGGPTFTRSVCDQGTLYNPLLYVKLWPVRSEIYICNSTSIQPTGPPIILYYKEAKTLGDINAQARGIKGVKSSTYRMWTKYRVENIVTITPLPESSSRLYHHPKRYLTSDQTEIIDGWKVVSNFDMNIEDAMSEKDCLEIIIEEADANSRFGFTRYDSGQNKTFPRDSLLQEWKADLRVGDVVDCQDKFNKWWETIVTNIDADGNLTMHFRGWGPSFDEIISKEDVESKIKPLHSKSKNWRSKIEEDDCLDVNVASLEAEAAGLQTSPPIACWLQAVVEEIDLSAQRVCVSYKHKDALDFISSKLSSTDFPSSLTNGVAGRLSVNDDDNTRVKRWIHIQSEDICALNTHTTPLPGARKAKERDDRYDSFSSFDYSSSSSRYESVEDNHVSGRPVAVGAVGLRNLGNTCFMNSILQCLSNTTPLTEAFLSNRYKSQLNFDNPLGHHGKLAQVYAKLLKAMWSDAYSIVVPRVFKQTIGEFQPQFAGYEQHDSQELMGFLIDGLHEDLNRIKNKPFTTTIESHGKNYPLPVISAEAWRRYLLRNDSELVDIMYGQTQSHVTCVNCNRESVTFEAFNCLSLPIPIKNTRVLEIVVQLLYPSDQPSRNPSNLQEYLPSTPLRVRVEIGANASVQEIKEAVVEKLRSRGVAVHVTEPSRAVKSVHSEEVITMGDTTITTHTPDSEDGYLNITSTASKAVGGEAVVVSHVESSGEETDDDFKLTKSKPKEKLPEPPSSQVTSQPVFHLCSLWTSNMSRISSTYPDTVALPKPSSLDCLFLTQLQHKVSEPGAGHRSSTYSYYPSSLRPNTVPVDTGPTFVDILFGETPESRLPTFSYSSSVTLFGFPVRYSYVPAKTSFQDIHEAVWSIAKARYIPSTSRFFTEGDSGPDTRPYQLVFTSSYGSDIRAPVSESPSALFTISSNECVLVRWRNNCKQPENFLSDKVLQVLPLPPLKDASGEPSDDTDDEDADSGSESLVSDTRTGPVKKARKASSKLSLYSCLDAFSVREKLPDTETYYCSNCKQHLPPLKKFDLWSAPDVLVMHLKRFQYTQGVYHVHRDKITDVVDFPIDGLDLSPYIKGPVSSEAPPIYDLYAVSLHSGSLHGGHYTAICRNPNGKWYNFNDSSVSETSPDAAVSGQAYVLFYRRRTGTLRWGGIVPLKEALPDE